MAEAQVAFDRGQFESDFTDFGKMLVDFGWITLALDAYEANKDWHAESGMGTQIRTSLMVGEKHPFSLTFTNYDFEFEDEEEARKHWEKESSGWKSFAEGWAPDKVATLRSRFDTIINPYPFQMSAAGSEFEDIRIDLGTKVGDDFAKLEYSQSHWHGQAASNFFENFYNPFPLCVLNEAWVSEMLQNGCNAAKAVLDMGRTSAMNTVSAMKKRLEEALAAKQDAHSISVTEFLTMASEILKIIDLLPIAIPDHLEKYVEKFNKATGDARKGAGALIGYADKAIPEESTITQSAGTQRPEGWVSDFSAAIDEIDTDLDRAWANLDSQYLTKVEHNIGALEEMKLLWLPRPDMASGPGTPGGFHHESSSQYT
jgi:hypothetical protein